MLCLAFRPPDQRQATLALTQSLKMARSAHAYVRGSTLHFYQWLRERGASVVPRGPAIWICGDCHVGNLGPVADANGHIDIQIRYFDQTVIGNPAHDLIRLALSLATAARGSDLPGVTTAKMLEHMTEGYLQALSSRLRSAKALASKPETVRIMMKRAMNRTWKHLAQERIDVTPTIPLGERYWPLSKTEKKEIKRLFAQPAVNALVTSVKSRKDGARIEALDAAYWMKGCSSLGRLRYAVLLGVGKVSKDDDFCLIDIKEATAAAAPRAPYSRMPRDSARRVVEGARHLFPNLGERMMPARFLGRSVFIRELLPQDLKLEIDRLTREEAVMAARFLAGVVGTAHARQMQRSQRASWRAVLRGRRSGRFDAPSWLWSSVVDLIVSHEGAYLEHCRKFALESE